MSADILHEVTQGDYKYGFTTDIETDIIPIGLSEDVVRLISAKKNEPEWMLEFRLKAYRHWLTMKMPEWAHLDIPKIDYQSIAYYAAPRKNAPKGIVWMRWIPNCSRHLKNWAFRFTNVWLYPESLLMRLWIVSR